MLQGTTAEQFWPGKRVLITGHTGFKGAWLSLWLHARQARVTGYALAPPTVPSLFEAARLSELIDSRTGDVNDLKHLQSVMDETRPEVVLHLAAQSLVRPSYSAPVETFATNIMGTVHLLEAVRNTGGVRAVVIVTSDKCYENREWIWGYRENESMGGHDPYSASKGCAELVTAAWRRSFFPVERWPEHGTAVATARAGNVIGGGDWALDRLVPDIVGALLAGRTIVLRNPGSVRPWQHVLEPLGGYLRLAERLFADGTACAEAWNFGPGRASEVTVGDLAQRLKTLWGSGTIELTEAQGPHEAGLLRLDTTKAATRLDWRPRLGLDEALALTVSWHRRHAADPADARQVTLEQIAAFEARV